MEPRTSPNLACATVAMYLPAVSRRRRIPFVTVALNPTFPPTTLPMM